MPFIRKSDLERLIQAGNQLSNIAYNLKQGEGKVVDGSIRASFHVSQTEWDAARLVVRKATERVKEEPKK